MVGEVFAAVGGFKALLDTAKALKDMNDAAVRNAAVIDLQEKILAAQEAQAELAERIRTLEKEVTNFETWETEKQKYELKNLGLSAAFALMLKPAARGAEPPHWVCAKCFGSQQISIIQHGAPSRGGRSGFYCPSCRTEIFPTAQVFAADGKIIWLD
jgi:hypothetical protein